MDIRAFQDADKREVIALWRECGLVVPQNDPAKDIDRKLQVDRELFLVGTLDEHIVATVMPGYEGHRGWINYLAVLPSQQRHGHGRSMMQHAEGLLTARGCPKINLQVRTSNAATIAFYQSLGYLDDNVIGLGKRLQPD